MSKFIKLFTVCWVFTFFCWLIYCLFQFDLFKAISDLAPYWPLYLIASLVSYVLATLGWRYLDSENELDRINFLDLFFIRQAGESLGQINPLGVVGGDVLKTKLIKKVIGNGANTLSSIYFLRIQSILSFVVISVGLLLLLIYQRFGLLNINFWFFAIIALFVITGVYLFLRYIFHFLKVLMCLLESKFKNPIFNKLIVIFSEMENISKQLFQTRNSFFGHFLLILHWMAGGFEVYLILFMMGLKIDVSNAFLVDSGTMIVKTIGQVIPAQVGVEELGNKLILQNLVVVAPSTWIVFSLLRRLRQILWIIISFIYLFLIKYGYTKNENSLSIS